MQLQVDHGHLPAPRLIYRCKHAGQPKSIGRFIPSLAHSVRNETASFSPPPRTTPTPRVETGNHHKHRVLAAGPGVVLDGGGDDVDRDGSGRVISVIRCRRSSKSSLRSVVARRPGARHRPLPLRDAASSVTSAHLWTARATRPHRRGASDTAPKRSLRSASSEEWKRPPSASAHPTSPGACDARWMNQSLHPLLPGAEARPGSTRRARSHRTRSKCQAARWAPSVGNSQPRAFIVACRGTAEHTRLLRHLAGSSAAWAPSVSLLVANFSHRFVEDTA